MGFRSQDERELQAFASHDIVITTFSTVELARKRSNIKRALGKTLQHVHWRRVVIDEMQEIRSSTTQVAQMCESLSADARWMVRRNKANISLAMH